MNGEERVLYRFGLFELDPGRGELRREGRVVPLRPLSLRALHCLVERRGQVVAREELRTELWGAAFLEVDSGLNTCLRDVRRALGERAARPVYIETVRGRGYRFIAPLSRVTRGGGDIRDESQSVGSPAEHEVVDPSQSRASRWKVVLVLAVALGGLAVGLLHLAGESTTVSATPHRRLEQTGREAQARAAFLEGRYLLGKNGQGDARRALERFRVAVALAPQWAEAHVAEGKALLAVPEPPELRMPAAKAAFERALALEPTVRGAHLGLASAHLAWDWDLTLARAELAEAERIDGVSSELLQVRAMTLLAEGRMEEALRAMRIAVELDPVSARLAGDIGWLYSLAGDFRSALVECTRGLELEPEAHWLQRCVAESHRAVGELDQSVVATRRELELKGASAEDLKGLEGEAASALAFADHWRLGWLLDRARDTYVPSCALGFAYAETARVEEALDALERAVAERQQAMLYASLVPSLRRLRGEPRLEGLLKRIESATVIGRESRPDL